ncbi:unnamed protein product [Chondrus crispus]|uniref:Uncharacterized protein n=1 Tax=Chondrus crispus TaxID=2769 RepID=R7QIQ6_CHOCR|nr:unnamed protein product [Chondrus crispus]CDF37305.1 unnamed protein product [Chondrus crispus]|eukprot:XP_005717124.1 unnamed protein product [Chondrus crispus]
MCAASTTCSTTCSTKRGRHAAPHCSRKRRLTCCKSKLSSPSPSETAFAVSVEKRASGRLSFPMSSSASLLSMGIRCLSVRPLGGRSCGTIGPNGLTLTEKSVRRVRMSNAARTSSLVRVSMSNRFVRDTWLPKNSSRPPRNRSRHDQRKDTSRVRASRSAPSVSTVRLSG